ncbi:hypothetical protein BH10ACI2_BH10ACI2_03140 [soil metagenome]
MARILNIGPFSTREAIRDGVTVITPHRAAASSLNVPYFSLPRLARDVLRKCRGLSVAPDMFARHTLKRVISRSFPHADTTSIAARISEILRTVLRVGIDIDELIERGSPQVSELGIIVRAYKDELLKHKYIDREELLWAAAHCDMERRPVYVFGHHRARKEEVLLIDAIAGDGSTYFLPCGTDPIFTANRDWAERLALRGWTVDDGASNTARNSGERLAAKFIGLPGEIEGAPAVSYSNVEAEIRGVLSQAKQMIVDGVDPYEIAIVCRDQDRYAPVISVIADEYRMPIQIKQKICLSETVLGGFVRLLLDAVDQEFAYEAAARLLIHPFGPEKPEGAWTAARRQHSSGLAAWTALGFDLSAMDWPKSQSFTSWTISLKAAVGSFGVREKAAQTTREILAYDKLMASLAGLQRLEGSRVLKFEEFSALLSEILADESVPFAPSAVGPTLFEPNTILGATFDHVFVLGMSEGDFPAPATDNPVIDFYERNRLSQFGIEFEDAADVTRWEELSFYLTLLTGRRSVSFSFAATVDDGEKLESSFFSRLGLRTEKLRSETANISSVEEWRTVFLRNDAGLNFDEVIARARHHFTIELSRENSPVYDEYDGVIGVGIDPAGLKLSASQLTAIGQCAFRWFAKRILRLDSVEEVELGLDYTKRGTFYHRVLEIAVDRAKDHPDIRRATLENLETAFAEAEADPEVALPTLVNWDLQRKEHINTLRKAVESPDFIAEGSRVLGLEQEFEEIWHGFLLTGTIDRVDLTPDGLIAIDYKTSSVAPKGAKDESGKLAVDVQIPLYSNVALRSLYPDGKLGDSLYYSLVKGKVLRQEKKDDYEKLEALAERIKLLLAAGNFAVDPDSNEDACTYCEFDSVCRKGPRLERKLRNQ